MRRFILVVIAALLIAGSWAMAQNLQSRSSFALASNNSGELISSPPKQRVEVGLVRWGRDLEAAQKQSKESGKPILLLFQEVPG